MNIKHIYTAVVCLLINNYVFSQWVQTGGPYGHTLITSLFTNNSRIYAGTSCGLHSTGSLTDKWDLKSTLTINAYIKRGNIIYYGGDRSGIRRLDLSQPGFVSQSAGLDGVTIISIKEGDTCLYAGIEGQGFGKSRGMTTEWSFFNVGLPAEKKNYPPDKGGGIYYVYHVNSIETIDHTLFCATHEGVYRTEMSTIVWMKSSAGISNGNVQLIKVIGSTIYAARGNALYSSTNKGDSWNEIYRAGSTISTISKINDYLCVSTLGSGIYGSADNGLTWNPQNNGLSDLNVTALTLINNTPVCGTATRGVFYYNGQTWVSHSNGIICSDIRSMATTKNSIAANDENDVYLSTGNSNSWTTISPALTKNYFGSIATMSNRILLSYKEDQVHSHVVYTTGNNTWQELNTAIPFEGDDPYRMCINGDRLYLYENEKMVFTDNLGTTWGNLTLTAPYCNDIYHFLVYKNIPFAASCGNGELLRLSDKMQWDLSNNGLPTTREITSMAYSENALYAYSYTNGVFVSRDEGKTWAKASAGFYTDWNIRSFAYYKDNIFVSTVKGVYYSTDYGQNWNLMNEGLKNSNVGPLVIFNDTLYAGSHGNGIWKHDLSDFLPVKEDSSYQIQAVRIFPNPATAFVRFDIKDYKNAHIKIIDILGRELISTILDEKRQINVSQLKSGTYVVVITNDKYILYSKLIKQ